MTEFSDDKNEIVPETGDINEYLEALKKNPMERREIDLRYIVKALKMFEYSSKLENFDNDAIALSFARIMKHSYFQKERIVFHKEDNNDQIYFILSGTAVIFNELTTEAFAASPVPNEQNVESPLISQLHASERLFDENEESPLFKPRMSRRKVRDLTSIIDAKAPFRLRISSTLPITYDEMYQYLDEKPIENQDGKINFQGETQELLASEKTNQDFKKKMSHYKLLEGADRERPGRYVSQNRLLFKVKEVLHKNQHFGETKLNANNIKDATVIAAEDLHLMSFSLREYLKLFHKNPEKSDYAEFLKIYFPEISYNKLLKVTNLLEECHFNRRHVVYEEDAEIDGLYFIKEGEVQIQKNLNLDKYLTRDEELLSASFKRTHIIASLGPGEVFGEEELLCQKEWREYTVVVTSVKARLFKLKSSVYQKMNKAYRDLFNTLKKGIASKKKFHKEQMSNKLNQVAQAIEKHDLTEKAKIRQDFYSNLPKDPVFFPRKDLNLEVSMLNVRQSKKPIDSVSPQRQIRSNTRLHTAQPLNSEYFRMSETPKASSNMRKSHLKIFDQIVSSTKKETNNDIYMIQSPIPFERGSEQGTEKSPTSQQKSIIYKFESLGENCLEFELEGQLSPYRRALIPLKRTLEVNSFNRDFQSPSPNFDHKFDFTPSRRKQAQIPRLKERDFSPKTEMSRTATSFEIMSREHRCRPGTALSSNGRSQQALSKYKMKKIAGARFGASSPDQSRIHGQKSMLITGSASRGSSTKRCETSVEHMNNSYSLDTCFRIDTSREKKVLSSMETIKAKSKREGFLPSKLLVLKKKKVDNPDKNLKTGSMINNKILRNISLLSEDQRLKINKILG